MTGGKRVIAGLAGLAALSVLAAAGPASAQRAAKPPGEIKITNMRAAPLTALEITTSGDQPRLIARLAKPLAPGKSASLKLNKPSGCSYFVMAKFEDEAESENDGVDLCKDKVLRLTE
ncbi:MAG: hypothetical protein DI527_19300 [Chelatococcus sp.]|nr:MAG: hypothetical protein DI527_19300 [Chelatococcus sp.]